jgi:hypothetical protein
MVRDKQEQTRLQRANGQLKPYNKLLLYFKSFVEMDTMESGFTSMQKANQTWNIPSHPYQITSLVRQDP